MFFDDILSSLDIHLLAVGRRQVGREWNFQNINSYYNRLIWVHDGAVVLNHSGKSYEVEAGTIHLVPCYTSTDYLCNAEEAVLNYIHFTSRALGGLDVCRLREYNWQRDVNEVDHFAFEQLLKTNPSREIAQYVDVMIGNEEDFTACLGFEIQGADENLTDLDVGSFQKMIAKAVKEFPNFKATATTMRGVKTATINDWGAMCWVDGEFYTATHRPDLEILDRVGGGDSFASGFIYGLMERGDPQLAVEYGAAHGALAMTTPGDTTMASLAEVKKIVAGAGARVDR